MATVIVAIPSANDRVWKVSSEKIPHLTLLFLGEQESNPRIVQMQEFLEHVAATSLRRFGLSVNRRDTLGDDKADVIFFEDYCVNELKEIRAFLLGHEAIVEAYNSVEQFPNWTPHLTLGYPETPAKSDDRDYQEINWVSFDRLAFWVGDFTGPEFRLKDYDGLETSMSNVVGEVLSHYGKKGMKWGVTNKDTSPTDVSVSQKKPGGKVKTAGGKNQPAADDAVKARTLGQKAKASTTHSLSDHELQALVRRMNLEQQYTTLAAQQKAAGHSFIRRLLTGSGKRAATNVSNTQTDEASRRINQRIAKSLAAKAALAAL